MYGWYSAAMDRLGGHAIYLTPEGIEIKITEVVNTIDERPASAWNDNVYLGEVSSFVRSNKINHYDPNRDINEQAYELLVRIEDSVALQKRCRNQVAKTKKCFCFTCPINNKN